MDSSPFFAERTRRDFLRSAAWLSAGCGLTLSGRAAGAFGSEPAAKPLKLLILGGTGFLGPQFVEAAIKRGHTVTLFNRGKTNPKLFPDLEKLVGDRKNNLKALEGRSWDAVVDTSGYFPAQVRDSATLLAPKVKQYVFISTCSVYADNSKPGMDETGAIATTPDPNTEKLTGFTYGPLKALCEQAAEKAMPGRVANIRPGLIVGRGDDSDRFTYWPVRVAKGGKVLAPHAPTEKIQFIDARDLGAWMVKVCENNIVGVFNALGPDKPLTIGKLLDTCKAVSKSDAEFVWADAEFLASQNVQPWSDLPVWAPNFGESAGFSSLSNARAIQAGLTFSPLEDTVKDTLDWFQSLPPERQAKRKAGLSPEREAKVLAAWAEKVKAKSPQ